MVIVFASALEVPILDKIIVPYGAVPAVVDAANVPATVFAGTETETTLTCAELVNDPNRPKTKPAMAIAAIKVIAIRMTVASTGLIAFRLRVLFWGFILCPYWKIPVKETTPPLDMDIEPVNSTPLGAAAAPIAVKVRPSLAPAPTVHPAGAATV